jgi:hypothetical protein
MTDERLREEPTLTDERQELLQLAQDSGWRRRDVDHVDVYVRGTSRIRVIWRGTSAISGAALYHDDILTTYTRDLPTVNNWMTR